MHKNLTINGSAVGKMDNIFIQVLHLKLKFGTRFFFSPTVRLKGQQKPHCLMSVVKRRLPYVIIVLGKCEAFMLPFHKMPH